MALTPVIPETVTVHLGMPMQDAQNVTVSFQDYIKNVASSEIYPTWPDAALRANIYAQISFTLNRIFTEYYPSRGYDFDITNSTAYDQSFVYGRDIFDNISKIVDELFRSYIRRDGFVEPLFAVYCDGVEVSCNGLSQWGTVSLANEGYTPEEIVRYYYGDNVSIVHNAPLSGEESAPPDIPLRRGTIGADVQLLQIRLNRISKNYPAIPKIFLTDGVFGPETEDAVIEFQRVFNLTPDGIVGPATWYRVLSIFNAVKRLNEITSEGLRLEEVSSKFSETLSEGMSGRDVLAFQYYLAYIGEFVESIPSIPVDGVFGPATRVALEAFQRTYGLPVTGILTRPTWDKIYNVYLGMVASVPLYFRDGVTFPFPGEFLTLGSSGEAVAIIQEYLNYIGLTYPEIPRLTVDGEFGRATYDAVIAFNRTFGLPTETGVVNPTVWNAISNVYSDLYNGDQRQEGQFHGYMIRGDE